MSTSPINSAIEVHDLSTSYENKPVLWRIDVIIPKGKVVGIIGPNGAGKSTLLKAMMGLIELDSGYVKVFNKPLDYVRDKVSYVPQKDSLDWDFPILVKELVIMGRYKKIGMFSKPKALDYELVNKYQKKLGIEELANRQISQLSGGQQQRVLIARALCQEAEVYLMDEPFVGVDATTESIIMEILHELAKEGKTVIIVHHELQKLKEYFDWCIFLNTRLIAAGPTNEVVNRRVLEEAYGSGLSILTKIGKILNDSELPQREEI